MPVARGTHAAELPARTARLSAVAIVAAAAACYANSFAVPFLLDDRAPGAPLPYRTRPLVWATFALNRAWTGAETWSYHFVNLCLHVGCALLLLGVLRRTVARAAAGLAERSREGLCLTIALAWTCHPLQTAVVTYLSQRAESLGSFFVLASVYAAIRARDAARPRAWQALSLVALALGFGAKEIAAVTPLLVWLHEAVFTPRRARVSWRERRGFHVALVLTAVAGFAAFVAPLLFDAGASMGLGFRLSGTGPLEYARTQPGVVLHYLRLAIWPHPLVFDRSWPIAQGVAEWLPQTLAVLGLLALAVVLCIRRAWTGYALAWFFVLLAPTSSFVPIEDASFEHRPYLALAGPLALLVGGGRALLVRTRRPGLAPRAAVLLVLALALGAVHRNHEFRTAESVWRTVVERAPWNRRGYTHLASALAAQGREEEAMQLLQRALEIDPDYHEALNQLGNLHLRRGEPLRARELFERAHAANPDPVYLHASGNALFAAGELARAEETYLRAIAASPARAEYHQSRGNALMQLGRDGEAIAEYREALRLDPELARSHQNLAVLLDARGEHDAALAHHRRALELPPEAAEEHYNLAQCLVALGRRSEAEAELRSALRLAPELVEPHVALARLLADPSGPPGARAESLELARRAEASSAAPRADVLEALAAAHEANGAPAQAIRCLERALELPGPRRNPGLRARLEAELGRLRRATGVDPGAPR